MKPREILDKIIKNKGSCAWVSYQDTNDKWSDICDKCPLCDDIKSCLVVVSQMTGDVHNKNYLEAAIRILSKIEVERILLRNDDDV